MTLTWDKRGFKVEVPKPLPGFAEAAEEVAAAVPGMAQWMVFQGAGTSTGFGGNMSVSRPDKDTFRFDALCPAVEQDRGPCPECSSKRVEVCERCDGLGRDFKIHYDRATELLGSLTVLTGTCEPIETDPFQVRNLAPSRSGEHGFLNLRISDPFQVWLRDGTGNLELPTLGAKLHQEVYPVLYPIAGRAMVPPRVTADHTGLPRIELGDHSRAELAPFRGGKVGDLTSVSCSEPSQVIVLLAGIGMLTQAYQASLSPRPK